ncbi:MAG: acyl-CoA dehydrogenase family protein [Labilithrix sp.]|nr:acyl-CoA dehydrogenase family protein [Labilithrix sp.]
MISFDPTDDQKLMVESVAQFARTTLRPKIRELEKAREVPEAIRRTAHELGLGLVALPEAIGGAGLGLTTAVMLEEEIAFGDPAAGFAFAGPGAFGFALQELATAEQAKKALEPFAADASLFGAVAWGERKPHPDRAGLSTTATKNGGEWKLDGKKAYVVNADRAKHFVVFAQVDASAGWRGLGAFLVDKDAKGLSVAPRETTLGLDAASFGGIALDGVIVPDGARLHGAANDFNAALVRFFARQALVVAARSVGLSRAAFEVTREYVDGRKAFGKPIGHFQAVAFTVADRAMDVDASRGLVWRAAAAWDAFDKGEGDERECLLTTAQAVAYAHEAAMRCGDDGVQLHGGAGFMRDYPVEKFMRDAKQLGLCAMTAEHADQLAGAMALGVPVASVDPGLVLPTPETQNAFV